MHSIKSGALAAIVVVVLGGGIAGSAALGYWKTESDRVPSRFETGEYAGLFDPADIRGSYSLQDVSDAFSIPIETLAEAFGLSELTDVGPIEASMFESIFISQPDGGEVGTDALRLFVSLYSGLPYQAEETTRLPGPAFDVLSERLAPADRTVLAERIVPLDALLASDESLHSLVVAAEAHEDETDEIEHDTLSVEEIRGRTTFGDLLSWGLTEEQVEEVIGMQIGIRAANVRDTLAEAGLEFNVYRDLLQQLLEEQAQTVGE